MSKCHATSEICLENQQATIEQSVTVHCIHPVRGYRLLFGFVNMPPGPGAPEGRRARVRKVEGGDTWQEYERSGLDGEFFVDSEYMAKLP
jgi:hypothetical protein